MKTFTWIVNYMDYNIHGFLHCYLHQYFAVIATVKLLQYLHQNLLTTLNTSLEESGVCKFLLKLYRMSVWTLFE